MKLTLFPTLKRAVTTTALGLAVLVLSPFVFFPEIMGDAGPRDVAPLRNYAALAAMILGASAALLGAIATLRHWRGESGTPKS
jgi:hypothetical protein